MLATRRVGGVGATCLRAATTPTPRAVLCAWSVAAPTTTPSSSARIRLSANTSVSVRVRSFVRATTTSFSTSATPAAATSTATVTPSQQYFASALAAARALPPSASAPASSSSSASTAASASASAAPKAPVSIRVRQAQCVCGGLTATCFGEPVRVGVCHCLSCQRRTGSIFGTQSRWESKNVTIAGASRAFTRQGDSGGSITFHFCPSCGSTLYWLIQAFPGVTSVPVGAFADPSFPTPGASIYESVKHSWAHMSALDSIPHME